MSGAEIDDATVTLDAARPQEPAAEARPVLALIVVQHPDPAVLHRLHVLDRPLEIGRGGAPFGAGALAMPSLSRRHALIESTARGVVVRDLQSRNGTFVGGARIGETTIARGAVVQVGELMLLLGEVDRAQPAELAGELVFLGAAMAAVARRIARLAPTEGTLLLQGSPGVGKDVVARRIHAQSRRAGPFVAVNCAALSDALALGELFGHREGAYTGARSSRRGLVASAEGGTLFLDEIGDASAPLQAALLRLLEAREYRPLGSDVIVRTDARFIAATHVPLRSAVVGGGFREDLHGRIARTVIEIPPLGARPEDISPIARHLFAQRASNAAGPPLLTDDLVAAMLRYPWPGNVRELDAFVEEATLLGHDGAHPIALTADLAARLAPAAPLDTSAPAVATPRPGAGPAAGAESLELAVTGRPDAATLTALLASVRGNVQLLAERMGVGRATVYRWFRETGVTPEQVRRDARRQR